ncbi:heme-binding protein [Streptomyces sp. NPDC006872]|uniref:GlcG/HbpS family heme-binding protein n=1 Tax=Streptomyces sp. NPDC006872 TaxID=3155720 RepID=UPI0033D01A93
MSEIVITEQLGERGVLKMLKFAVEKARELGAPVGVGIVDAGGHLRSWALMDGAPRLVHDVVLKKARTAAYMGQPTGDIPPEPATALSLAAADFVNLPGGLPVIKDGKVIGAIGVGGSDPKTDILVAEAGIAALDLT